MSEKEAKNCGIKAMTGETTNVASSKVFQKAKFTKLTELRYDEYRDKNGKQPFANLEPHNSCAVWTKSLL